MPDGERARRIILARRAHFIAVAFGVAGCGAPARPPDASTKPIETPPLASDAGTADATVRVQDRDHDGIADVDDVCPDIAGPPSADPKINGCPKVIVSVCLSVILPPKVTFALGSSNVGGGTNAATIDEIAKVLEDHPDIEKIDLEGHTDPTENVQLGRDRADAVKRELVRRGIDAKRITTSNAGASKPIEPNRTAEGRARNRRVEPRMVPSP